MTNVQRINLQKSFEDISYLATAQKYVQYVPPGTSTIQHPFENIYFVIHGGSAFAHWTDTSNTKDLDVLVVAPDFKNRFVIYWNHIMMPYFQGLGYTFHDMTYDIKPFAKKYGAFAATMITGPRGNVIDLGFGDSNDFEGNWTTSTAWHTPIGSSDVRVLARDRLAMDLATMLVDNPNPNIQNRTRNRLSYLVQTWQQATAEDDPDLSKRFAKALERTPVHIKGWKKLENNRGSFDQPVKMYQVLITALGIATPWLERAGLHVALKGGTVSTQYTGRLEPDDIDIEVFRTTPHVNFVPTPRNASNTGRIAKEKNQKNWARYFGESGVHHIVGLLVFLVSVLRTIDKKELMKIAETAVNEQWTESDMNIELATVLETVTDLDICLRMSRIHRSATVLASIDILLYIRHPVTLNIRTETCPVFDCVFGNVHKNAHVPSPENMNEQWIRVDPVRKLKMQSSKLIDENMINMVEGKAYKREKRLLRFLKKKAGGDSILVSLAGTALSIAPPRGVSPTPISLQNWMRIERKFINKDHSRFGETKRGILAFLGHGNANLNVNMNNVNLNVNMNNANRINANANRVNANRMNTS